MRQQGRHMWGAHGGPTHVLVARRCVLANLLCFVSVGTLRFRKKWRSHIVAPHSRQPLVNGGRLVCYEVNAVMCQRWHHRAITTASAHMCWWWPAQPLLPQRVCCSWLGAMPVQHARIPEQAQEDVSPMKNRCGKQVSSWRHISCHTDKSRYYT